ncbi:FXYD domain-containing ion transport regulator 5-like isoform X1 [Elgaria multicarinata webbii]|uniref:FXYD domain-containing ion transport regulator 5-like isoform X1 n=1 Tax=Elgaria multicarinata webbii TaxID=159646 RepID=UPI002FCCFBD4
MTVGPSLCSQMPGMPHAWCCGASAMKLLLLLVLASLTAVVDAQGTTVLTTEWKEESTYITTTEAYLLTTTEEVEDASTPVNSGNVLEEKRSRKVETTSTAETTNEVIRVNSTSSVNSTSAAGVTSPQKPPVSQERRNNVQKTDDPFFYDYPSLRKWGLIAAAILFIMGILILTCGKHGKFPRCRGKKQTRTYDVTQA